jgi:hypothetical protein
VSKNNFFKCHSKKLKSLINAEIELSSTKFTRQLRQKFYFL